MSYNTKLVKFWMIWGYPSRRNRVTQLPRLDSWWNFWESARAQTSNGATGVWKWGISPQNLLFWDFIRIRWITIGILIGTLGITGWRTSRLITGFWGALLDKAINIMGPKMGIWLGYSWGCEMMWIIGTKTWESSVGNYPKGPNSKHQKGGSRQQIVKWTATTGLCWQKFRGCL